MLMKIFGILGHLTYFPPITAYFPILFLWMLLMWFRYYKIRSILIQSIILIICFYGLFIFSVNYNSELVFGFRGLGLQGRYLFPIIGTVYVLYGYCLTLVNDKFIRLFSLLITIFLFFVAGPIRFVFDYSFFMNWFN